MFLDPNVRIISPDVSKLFTLYGNKSIVGWETRIATTTLTHPKMFDYFRTPADNFFFLPLVLVDKLIMYNTLDNHQDIMLPWIQCALISECISPIGMFTGSGFSGQCQRKTVWLPAQIWPSFVYTKDVPCLSCVSDVIQRLLINTCSNRSANQRL